MRALLALSMMFAAEAKKPSPAPAAAPAPPPVAAPAPAPEPEPEPVAAVTPPEQRPHNANFYATISWADGSVTKGNVVRVERSEDWYGEQGWTDVESKLKVTLEGGGTEIDSAWTNLSSVTITYGSPVDADCTNDSSFEPAMYMCVLRNTTAAKTRDGKSWQVADRHKWLFVFSSGSVAEFYVSKLPARKQDDTTEEGLNSSITEQETRLYGSLQAELTQLRTGKVPKSITITAQ